MLEESKYLSEYIKYISKLLAYKKICIQSDFFFIYFLYYSIFAIFDNIRKQLRNILLPCNLFLMYSDLL